MVKKKNIESYLTGKLLLAMPGLGDSRFHRAVIFMCAHDKNGAMGLVVNNEVPNLSFQDMMTQIKTTSNIHVDVQNFAVPVLSGGPVESGRGFLLHTDAFKQKDTIAVDERYSVTGTIDALKDVAEGNGPEQILFILGYAGWGSGQLENEIQQNSWLVVEPDHTLVFETPAADKWEAAVKKIGIDPALLSTEAGHA